MTTDLERLTNSPGGLLEGAIIPSMEIDLVIGGYFAYKYGTDTEWSLMRLLDLNSGALHYTIFKTKFSSLPTEEDISKAEIFSMHAPVSIEDLINMHEMTLIAEKSLTDEDLEGYAYYVEAHATSKEEAKKELEETKALSGKHAHLRVTQENGKITVNIV